MGALFPDKREPIRGLAPRLKNIVVNNYRGLIGVIIPICAILWKFERFKHKITVEVLWMLMFWLYLVQPVSIPATGMIPIFFLPMGGVMSTFDTTKCYFNENIGLFILSSMLILLLNNSGYDRRLSLWFLCSGDACQFSGKRILVKASAAAFVLSMFSNRLIVTSTLIQYVTPIYQNLKTSYGKSTTEPNFQEMGYIINNAIQTSSALGSTAIMHSAYASLAFRALWCEAGPKGKEYPDIFNYIQWSAYAFPTAFVMWLINLWYHMLLINFYTKRPMSSGTMNEVRTALLKTKQTIPKQISLHELLTIFFTFVSLCIFFTRWNEYDPTQGWAGYQKGLPPVAAPEGGGEEGGGDGGGEGGGDEGGDGEGGLLIRMRAISQEAPVIKDAVVAAIFVVLLHLLPKSLDFLKVFRVMKKSELKNLKPESGILWWRFVDQNTNYAYIFVLGSGIALMWSIKTSGLAEVVGAHIGKQQLTSKDWYEALFVICLLTCVLANVMSGVASLVVFLPLIIIAGEYTEQTPWAGKVYLAALAVGIGSSFGFMCPFMFTPAYFCHHVGKVPISRMCKYSFLSVVICMLLLWFSLCFWAPWLWDHKDQGIRPVTSPVISKY